MNAKAINFLTESLNKVESKSIQAWARSDNNYPIFLKMAQNALDNGKYDSDLFATYIVSLAMGL